MKESQNHGVQTLPLESKGTFCRPVNLIPEQRMTAMGHVHPDLMRPAGFQPALDIRVIAEPFQYPAMSESHFAVPVVDRPFFPTHSMTTDGSGYRIFARSDLVLDC